MTLLRRYKQRTVRPMPRIDPDGLHPTLIARLRAELNRVRPPQNQPRYLSAGAPTHPWRLAPIALAIAFTGILALTAFAATGSPNPAVWTNRVETVINPPSPSPESESTPTETQQQAVPAPPPAHKPTAQPTQRAEPSDSPEHESPEPGDGRSGTSSTASSSRSGNPPGDH